jgi:hypothetical protein
MISAGPHVFQDQETRSPPGGSGKKKNTKIRRREMPKEKEESMFCYKAFGTRECPGYEGQKDAPEEYVTYYTIARNMEEAAIAFQSTRRASSPSGFFRVQSIEMIGLGVQ